MKLTADGEALIKQQEGLRLTVYNDLGGKPTIGWGHLIKPGEDFSAGIDQDQAQSIFDGDVQGVTRSIGFYLKSATLNDNEFSALVSLVFNEGVAPLLHTMGELLNAGDNAGAANQFSRWVYVNENGKMVISQDLVGRRAAERKLFLTPVDDNGADSQSS